MNISSLIVGARPERVTAVCNALREIDGVELHAATPQGQLIVTVETESDGLTTELFARIGGLDGVVDVAMGQNR